MERACCDVVLQQFLVHDVDDCWDESFDVFGVGYESVDILWKILSVFGIPEGLLCGLDERLTVAEIEKALEIFDSCFQTRVYLLPVNVDYWASSRHRERNKFLGSGHGGSQVRGWE